MELWNWLKENEELFAVLGLSGIGLFLVSLLVFPLIIILLPHDYFIRPETSFVTLNPLRMLLRVLKNALGYLLIVAGILMLFLPGQGLLSLLLGVSLINFPGKRRLELRLLRFRGVRRSVAWIRQKANRRPVIFPEEK